MEKNWVIPVSVQEYTCLFVLFHKFSMLQTQIYFSIWYKITPVMFLHTYIHKLFETRFTNKFKAQATIKTNYTSKARKRGYNKISKICSCYPYSLLSMGTFDKDSARIESSGH